MQTDHSTKKTIQPVIQFLVVTLLLIGILGFSNETHAQLNAPTLSLQVDDLTFVGSWTPVDGAIGYMFYYAPYPDATYVYEMDMGKSTSTTVELWEGAAFFTAVAAYNEMERSDFSNIEHFIITKSTNADDSGVTLISFNGDTISVNGSGAVVEGSHVVITSAGAYNLEGTLNDGQVIVDTEDAEDVNLYLNGVNINCSTSAPIFIKKTEHAVIVLSAGSENSITDASTYVFDDPEEDEPDAALFSKSDLTIKGSGTLTVNANYNDAVKSKDGLDITGGTLKITSVDDGIIGKDYISIQDGYITVNAKGDGLKSTNDEDSEKGYITINNGVFNITSGADAIQAETNINIASGSFTLLSGGGAGTYLGEDDSAKGLKGGASVTVSGGVFTIDSADDAIHTNGNIVVDGGEFSIASGDDGFHADADVTINSGVIHITKSYEGIEGATITINGGNINIVSSDDGINAAGGADSSGLRAGMGGPGGNPFQGGPDSFINSGDYHMYINGGAITINAEGDGLDSNGTIEMNGGVVIVNGPTGNGNGALDYVGSFTVNNGFLAAAGSSGMAEAPTSDSTQNAVLVKFASTMPAGTLLHIEDGFGNDLLTFAPAKTFQSLVYSSPDLILGSTYELYYGGSASGTQSNGLYEDASYTPGTKYTEFTINSTITTIR